MFGREVFGRGIFGRGTFGRGTFGREIPIAGDRPVASDRRSRENT